MSAARRRQAVRGSVVLILACALVGAWVTSGVARASVPTGSPLPVRVVLPQGYADSRAHWPVVYVLNTVQGSCPAAGGETCRLEQKIVDAAATKPFITVFESEPAALSDYIDWDDGSQHNDKRYVALFDWVDHRYRTLPDRRHRALAGVSAGAYGGFVIAARHPNLFAQLGSISGPLDIRGRADSLEPGFVLTGGPSPTTVPTAIFGAPFVSDATWAARNPRDLVSRLKGSTIWIANGNGVPCDASDGPQANPIGSVIEGIVGVSTDGFVSAAKRAGITPTYLPEPCGVHTYRYFTPRVLAWLASLHF